MSCTEDSGLVLAPHVLIGSQQTSQSQHHLYPETQILQKYNIWTHWNQHRWASLSIFKHTFVLTKMDSFFTQSQKLYFLIFNHSNKLPWRETTRLTIISCRYVLASSIFIVFISCTSSLVSCFKIYFKILILISPSCSFHTVFPLLDPWAIFSAWFKVENMSLKVTGSFFSPCLWGPQRFGTLSHFEAVWLLQSSGKWNRCHKSAPRASSFLSCFFRVWIRCQWIVSPSCRLFGSLFILLPFCSICCFCSYILN